MIISGCSKAPAQTSVKAVAATQSWNWESYPLVDKMRLGLLPCRVQPRSSTTINSPFTGLLRIYVDRAQTNIPAGFIWGEFEPKLLDATSKALAEDKRRLEERDQILLALRGSGLGTYSDNKGYLYDFRYGNSVGYNMSSFDAFAIALGVPVGDHVLMKVQYAIQKIGLVRGVTDADIKEAADDANFFGAEIGVHF
jgi:hypothetical protein